MNNAVYAMDTYFMAADKPCSFDEKCRILSETGYDKTYLSLGDAKSWDEFSQLGQVQARYGIGVSAVYFTLDITCELTDPEAARVFEVIKGMQGCDTLELALRIPEFREGTSDPARDAQAERWLLPILDAAAARGIVVALYHHFGFWLEKIDDAIRLVERLKHPNLKLCFCGFHWYAVDRQDLEAKLLRAAPWLHHVNLCGSRPGIPGDGLPATIETLDQGEMDNAGILRFLKKLGFTGDIGFQGYSIQGDPRTNLKTSLDAYRKMLE